MRSLVSQFDNKMCTWDFFSLAKVNWQCVCVCVRVFWRSSQKEIRLTLTLFENCNHVMWNWGFVSQWSCINDNAKSFLTCTRTNTLNQGNNINANDSESQNEYTESKWNECQMVISIDFYVVRSMCELFWLISLSFCQNIHTTCVNLYSIWSKTDVKQ